MRIRPHERNNFCGRITGSISNIVESFDIITPWREGDQKVLVIPDDCTDKSFFHLVKDGAEYCKLAFTDKKQWQVLEDGSLRREELEELTKKIEEHYF